MPTFTTVVYNLLKPYSFHLTVTLMVIIFTLASVFFYYNFFAKSKYNKLTANSNKSTDIPNSGGNGTLVLHVYYVTWCPYCKTALPVVNGLQEKYDGRLIKDKKISFVISDITDTSKNKSVISEYNITSYPTIFLMKDGTRIDYKAKVTNDNMDKFLQTAS